MVKVKLVCEEVPALPVGSIPEVFVGLVVSCPLSSESVIGIVMEGVGQGNSAVFNTQNPYE